MCYGWAWSQSKAANKRAIEAAQAQAPLHVKPSGKDADTKAAKRSTFEANLREPVTVPAWMDG